jgi:hypothetical protein
MEFAARFDGFTARVGPIIVTPSWQKVADAAVNRTDQEIKQHG